LVHLLNRVPEVIEPGLEFTVVLWALDWGSAGSTIRKDNMGWSGWEKFSNLTTDD
jgi:hypothetical protein